jgi:hypothetical protein
MGRIRQHLTYANVISTLTLFLVLGGGTALAAYVVSSNSQIGPNTVSGHKPPSGDHANLISGSVNGQDVANNSLTGADIADRSGVDTCQTPLLAKFGPICAGSDGVARDHSVALSYCSGYGLRLPSLSEALTLANNYDVPGVNPGESFWTDDYFFADYPSGNNVPSAEIVTEEGARNTVKITTSGVKTVCVTDPSA